MEFRRRKAKGRSQQTYKEWVSDCGFFRITWINEYGYKHYQACVKVECKTHPFRWEFALRRGPYKTFKKAVEGCEKNKRLWDAFIKLSHSPGRRDGKLLALKMREPTVFFSLPLWVRQEAEPGLVRMLLCPSSQPDQSDHTEASETTLPGAASSTTCTSPSEPTQDSGPVSSATGTGNTGKKKTTTSSKATSSPLDTPAKTARAQVEAQKKPSKRSIAKSSPASDKPSKRGKKTTSTDAADSASSRKKKSAA
jgi:hypothetical protein